MPPSEPFESSASWKCAVPTRTRAEFPVCSQQMPWLALRDGIEWRPLRFGGNGWALQLRLQPGAVVARHRHTGEVHSLTLSGRRELIDTHEEIGPGTYVYEPPGNIDSWSCVGHEPCVVHINLTGRVEYLDHDDSVIGYSDVHVQRQTYLDWCAANGREIEVPMVHHEIR